MKVKVISFNSYKGGACRTTTCYNTLPYLAKELGATARQPIIVVDCDLDSMGLTNIFNANIKKDGRREKLPYSAKHMFIDDDHGINAEMRNSDFSDVSEEDYFKNFEKVGEKLGLEEDGSVLFLGVDRRESAISDKDYDDKEKFCQSTPLARLKTILDHMDESKQPKAIVLDCAAGVQITTLAVLRLIDYSVMCMRPTLQFRIGTRDYLYNMLPVRLPRRRQERNIILLPTSVAQSEYVEGELAADLEQLRNETICDIRENIVDFLIDASHKEELHYSLIPDMAEFDCFGLPEIERFKWEECLLYKREELTEQEKALRDRYVMLASILAKNDGE